jgi:hypothetical protein
MRVFVEALVGDAANLSVVALVMLAELALVFTGHAGAAVFVIPPLTLAGAAWLAWHQARPAR